MQKIMPIMPIVAKHKNRTNKNMVYYDFYEKLFVANMPKPKNLLEIGIGLGGSLRIWSEFFPDTNIYAIDIDPKKLINEGRIISYQVDQSKRGDLKNFLSHCTKESFDIIIDDGGHRMNFQQIAFDVLFEKLTDGGYYIIEDVNTSFSSRYIGDTDKKYTTYAVFDRFIKTGKMDSPYVVNKEMEKLCSCEIQSFNNRKNICVVIKKRM